VVGLEFYGCEEDLGTQKARKLSREEARFQADVLGRNRTEMTDLQGKGAS